MCAKNHLLTFISFLDIWKNVEWPRFFGPPGILSESTVIGQFVGYIVVADIVVHLHSNFRCGLRKTHMF